MTTIARERRDRLRALNERVKVQRRDRIWQRGFDEGVADKKSGIICALVPCDLTGADADEWMAGYRIGALK